MNFKNVLAIDNLAFTDIPAMLGIHSKPIQCDQDLFIACHFVVSNTSMSEGITVGYEASVDDPTQGDPTNWRPFGMSSGTMGADGVYELAEITDFPYNWIRVYVTGGGGDPGNVDVRLNIKGF